MNRYDALRIAVKAHAGQTDKCGRPYILHPLAVADAVEPVEQPVTKPMVVVALLHDVFEDTDADLGDFKLTTVEYAALEILTRREGEDYDRYLDQLCASGNRTALHVKLADLWHNLQPDRTAALAPDDRSRLHHRYIKARLRIWRGLGESWWPTQPESEDR